MPLLPVGQIKAVTGSEPRLGQVFLNLIGNARDQKPTGMGLQPGPNDAARTFSPKCSDTV